MRLTPLSSRDDLLAVTGPDDGYALTAVPAAIDGWTCRGAVGYVRHSRRRGTSLVAWGPESGLAALLDRLIADRVPAAHDVTGISVPLGSARLAADRLALGDGGTWAFMWTETAPPPNPREADLLPLDDAADAEEITALAARENPLFEGFPGTGAARCWIGARDERGDLVACGAIHALESGAPHLSGILVAASARRRGLGRAITGALTREALASDGVSTLGVYADNAIAIGLYEDLGYRTAVTWASRALVPGPLPGT